MSGLFEIVFKVLLAVLLSSIIGFERELRQKGAGLRTHILVGLGSTLIVLTSLHLFDIYKESTVIDPTRMITGIVTGIGFFQKICLQVLGNIYLSEFQNQLDYLRFAALEKNGKTVVKGFTEIKKDRLYFLHVPARGAYQ